MKILASVCAALVLLLFVLPYADGYLATRIVTVSLEGNIQTFTVNAYDFEKRVKISVDNATLAVVLDKFRSDTFTFSYKVSKYGDDNNYVQLEPEVKPGKRFEVKFVS
jgi:hypothetical protein